MGRYWVDDTNILHSLQDNFRNPPSLSLPETLDVCDNVIEEVIGREHRWQRRQRFFRDARRERYPDPSRPLTHEQLYKCIRVCATTTTRAKTIFALLLHATSRPALHATTSSSCARVVVHNDVVVRDVASHTTTCGPIVVLVSHGVVCNTHTMMLSYSTWCAWV